MRWTPENERCSLLAIEDAAATLEMIVEHYPSSDEDQAFDDVKKNAATILDLLSFIQVALTENWASTLTMEDEETTRREKKS